MTIIEIVVDKLVPALICELIAWLIRNLQNIIFKPLMVGFVIFSTANARIELAIHFCPGSTSCSDTHINPEPNSYPRSGIAKVWPTGLSNLQSNPINPIIYIKSTIQLIDTHTHTHQDGPGTFTCTGHISCIISHFSLSSCALLKFTLIGFNSLWGSAVDFSRDSW